MPLSLKIPHPHPLVLLILLLLLILTLIPSEAAATTTTESTSSTKQRIIFRAAMLHAPPFATVETLTNGTLITGGLQSDLLQRLQIFAAQDDIELIIQLEEAPAQYGPAFDLVANDCRETETGKSTATIHQEEHICDRLDIMVANFYATPARSLRAELSPSWLRSTISTIKLIDKTILQDITTLAQAQQQDPPATVCLKGGTFYEGVVRKKFPLVKYRMCPDQDNCLLDLKAERCSLYASDELQLRHRAALDNTLQVTREQFNTQYIVWAIKDTIPNQHKRWLKKWIYQAVTNATMDELFFKYFQKELCPVGTAGEACELPCDPDFGQADERGLCVCKSTKHTGDDCSIEVPEDLNLIPQTLKAMAYAMVGMNCFVILLCALWLAWQRNTTQVRLSQPFFLMLILLGCLISTMTIVAMALAEDEGDGQVKACMAIPWLYSVGFSITFGTLFAKIRRVYLIFINAANMRRHKITFLETVAVTGIVLLLDIVILIIWTIVDPLQWQRNVVQTDKFGTPLESEGHCSCNAWQVWIGAFAVLHLLLLGVACFLCHKARDISTQFSEGKYVAIAMFSNLQIFIVAVPILIILGADTESSFFVRTVVIWMNDLVVVSLIFGNLIYHVHFAPHSELVRNDKTGRMIGSAMQQFSSRQKSRNSSVRTNDGHGWRDLGDSDTSSGFFTSRGSFRGDANGEPLKSVAEGEERMDDSDSSSMDFRPENDSFQFVTLQQQQQQQQQTPSNSNKSRTRRRSYTRPSSTASDLPALSENSNESDSEHKIEAAIIEQQQVFLLEEVVAVDDDDDGVGETTINTDKESLPSSPVQDQESDDDKTENNNGSGIVVMESEFTPSISSLTTDPTTALTKQDGITHEIVFVRDDEPEPIHSS